MKNQASSKYKQKNNRPFIQKSALSIKTQVLPYEEVQQLIANVI
ncbi:hypothetical protein BACI71_90116 [Bacillus mycoides]|uniref:Uncharacterized protein n=1 Tax=Bacillus mycoides TaxID=1405 RepID=A0A654C2V5_BACMY|nr:hypothetical protein BACI71_90116 [Bacillus mycoides]